MHQIVSQIYFLLLIFIWFLEVGSLPGFRMLEATDWLWLSGRMWHLCCHYQETVNLMNLKHSNFNLKVGN